MVSSSVSDIVQVLHARNYIISVSVCRLLENKIKVLSREYQDFNCFYYVDGTQDNYYAALESKKHQVQATVERGHK